MSNSSLVNYVNISPNRTSPRDPSMGGIKNIIVHHMAGNLTVETCGNVFAPKSRQASSNYSVDSGGRVGMYCEEKDRAWTTGNRIDHSSVTIEVADDVIGGGWHSSDKAMSKLVELCADICRRNGIAKLRYTGDKSGNLLMHKWYQATDCPGAYLESKFPWIAAEVNKLLNGTQGPKQIPGNAANNNKLYYRAHCQTAGTLAAVRDGQTAGTVGYGKRLEGLYIDLRTIREKYSKAKLVAKVHIQDVGWKLYQNVEHNTLLGTIGQGRRMEAIELELTGVPDKTLYYRTHLAETGWTSWIKGGFSSGTVGISKAIEAIQIKLA